MDELERQVKRQRAELDQIEEVPVPELWTGIEERMAGQRSVSRVWSYQRWLVAACILVLVSLGGGFIWWQPSVSAKMMLSDVAPELAEQESAFLTVIAKKEAALKLHEIDRTTYAPFLDEISLVDSLRVESQLELPVYGANERLLNTIIRYYELKILLLEQLENDLAKQQYYGTPNQQNEI